MDGRSPSGKAPDFGSGIEGSNPSRPASYRSVGLTRHYLVFSRSAVRGERRPCFTGYVVVGVRA